MTHDEMLTVLAKFFRIQFSEDAAGVAEEIESLSGEGIDSFLASLDEIAPSK